ncbi:hypothetical protein [Roseateles amylovorans]|uniref:Uncharacterized protein n=1 Tax=Roseateles amylovorans TaxID=2978473 RepID=A0ABY6B4A0_9BURK|nr:hypothetical protein [Roseateles amylovorans]UXH80020.1 hypothetical protein N4261_09125 [Roseateles amylovorans]
MRGALSIIGLVIVFAIVMFSAKHQMATVQPSAPTGSPSSAGSTAAKPQSPQAVGQKVQDLMQQGEQRASEVSP